MVHNNTQSRLPSSLISFAIVSFTNISINYNVNNLQTAAICAIMSLIGKHRTLCHALPTDRLICSAKTVSFVVRNDFLTSHRRVLKLHQQ